MTANDNSWIAETVADFIHSPIWRAPIQTFIEENCAAFDYDDEDENNDEESSSGGSSIEEQKQIFSRYQKLVNSLIDGLRHDLDLDEELLKKACEFPSDSENGGFIDESFEQLYSANNFSSFQDMMRRKNLILQLQALVSLQLQWGLLKHSQTGDDLILTLLLEASKSPIAAGLDDRTNDERTSEILPSSKREIPPARSNVDDDDDDDDVVVEKKSSKVPSPRSRTPPSTQKKREKLVQPSKVPTKEMYRLPDLRRRDELDANWYRELRKNDSSDEDEEKRNESKTSSIPQSIGDVSENVLRQKLKELTDQTTSSVDDKTTAAIKSRKDFLQEQRKLLIEKRNDQRKQDLDQQTRNARPQSAAHVARKAMANVTTTRTDESNQTKLSDEELAKRLALRDKLKRVTGK